mmetsp:Transcript_17951/g.23481  ORF Transcript_17951/g.23481 Transcript_17951/m.23481 type:complete len:459 (+) Transcript_17951:39-1415(+)
MVEQTDSVLTLLNSWILLPILASIGYGLVQSGQVPEEPVVLVKYGMLAGLGSIVLLLVHDTLTQSQAEKDVDEKLKEQGGGYVMAWSLVDMIRKRKYPWVDDSLLQILSNILNQDLKSTFDVTQGGSTARCLLAVKLLSDRRSLVDLKEHERVKAELRASVRARAHQIAQFIAHGPAQAKDIILSKAVENTIFTLEVLVDHLSESLVLLIRGSERIQNYLHLLTTPIEKDSNELVGGREWQTFPSIIEAIMTIEGDQELRTVLENYKQYTRFVGGYGLGGTVATSLSLLMNDNRSEVSDIWKLQSWDAYVFGALPGVRNNGSESKKYEFIHTFATVYDIVPRLTKSKLNSLMTFDKKVKACLDPNSQIKALLSDEFDENSFKKLNAIMGECPGVLTPSDPVNDDMFHGSDIYLLDREEETTTCYTVVPQDFSREALFQHASALSQHLVQAYLDATAGA